MIGDAVGSGENKQKMSSMSEFKQLVTASVRENDTPGTGGCAEADMTMTPIAIASTKDDIIISSAEKIVGKKLEENQENHHGVFSKQFVHLNNGGNHQQNNTNGYNSNGQTFHNKSYKNYGNRRQYQNNNHDYSNYNNTHHHHHNNNNHHYNNQNGHYNNGHQNGNGNTHQQNHYNNNRQQRIHNNYPSNGGANGGQQGPNHHHNGNGDQQIINSLISPADKIIDENLYTTMLANKRRQQPATTTSTTTSTATTPTWNPLENESSGILTLNNKPFYTQPPPNIHSQNQSQQQNQLQAPTTTTTAAATTNTPAINNTSSNSSSSSNNNSHQRQPSPSPSSISNNSTSSNSNNSSSNKSHSSHTNGGPIVQQQATTNSIPTSQQNGGSYNNNGNMYVNGFYRHGSSYNNNNNGYNDMYNNGGRRQNHKNNNNNNNNNNTQFHYHFGYYNQPPPTSPSNFQQFCQQVPPPSLNILQRTNTKTKSSANSINSSDSNESIMSVTPEKSCTATTPCNGKNFLVGDWNTVNGSGGEMENTFYVEAENDYNCYSSRCESPGASSVSSQSSINNSIMNNNPKKSRYHSGGSCSEISNGIMVNNSIMEVSKSPTIFRVARKTNFPTIWNLKIDPVELVKDFSAIEMRDKPIGWNINEDDRYYELSKDIWKKFIENQQTMETFQKKMELWRDVYEVLKTNVNHPYSKYGLQIVGSTMSGFGSNSSDVDMCLLIRRTDVDQRYEAVDRLHGLLTTFRQTSFVENPEIIYAKVPILKFHDRIRNLDVDLNCNNYVGVRNTHLLYAYSQLDWRVKPLVLIVKLWAQIQGINDAKSMTISSYSLVLMVIHYLQTTDISVLPCLHQMYPDKFSPYVDVLKIKINEVFPRWNSKNNASLGELLLGFLDYYAVRFDFSRLAVSIRLGSTVSIKQCMQAKSYKNDPHQWKYICIEEPFDFTNTARSVYDKNAFDRIRGVFYISYQYLISTRRLDSIFNKISGEEARITADRLFPSLLNISS